MAILIILLVALFATPAVAQPRVTNGELQQAPIGATLTRVALDGLATKAGTAWFTYAVPIADGDRWVCDGMSYGDASIRLERSGTTIQNRSGAGDAAQRVMMLEGPRQLWVLYRLAEGRVERIRIASEECTLDSGGLPVYWMNNVPTAQSVALLASFLSAAASNRLADGALTALALHRDPAALDQLLTTARDGSTTHLRGQALFWLAQRAGEKAIGAISDAIANDPETDVKKRAVFALSQLPRDEGVPRLIDVARTNTNPAVRKQAMFWLGQSRDPRAVKFFEEILFK